MADYTTGLELILNACEGILQIVVTDDEKPLCFEQWHGRVKPTELLIPAIKHICDALGINPAHFRRIGCFSGPGSFTGIRLILTTAAAMRRASEAQLASLDYLQALATTAVQERGLLYGNTVFVLTHARGNQVHFQKFQSLGPAIPAQPMEKAELVTPGKALARIGPVKCLLCGSGLSRYPHLFSPACTGTGPEQAPDAIPLPTLINPSLSAICLLARHGDYFPRDVEPKYLMECAAVENLAAEKGYDSPEMMELEIILQQKPVIKPTS